MKEPAWMSLYKGLLAFLVYLYLESLGVERGLHCEIRESFFRHCWRWSEDDRSASALVIGRVQAMTRRQQMLGKASSSQTPKGCLEAPYLLTARVISIYAPHFQGIWEMECFSPRTAFFSSSSFSCSALFTIIDSTRQSKWRAWRFSSENRSCIWKIKESRGGIATDSLLNCNDRLDWNLYYNLFYNL